MAQTNGPIPALTATPSPTILEINLRRLMAKCDFKVHGTDRILQGPERSKYLVSIKALRDMLADLETEVSRSGNADPTAMKEYAEKIEALASAVEEAPSSPSIRALSQPRLLPQAPPSTAEGTLEAIVRGSKRTDLKLDPSELTEQTKVKREFSSSQEQGDSNSQSLLRERRPKRDPIYTGADSLGISQPGNAQDEQARVEAALQNDRAQREEMEAGLSRLMQQLRHNAQAIHQTLVDEQTSGVLDDADQSLDNNISRLGKERTRLELYSKQSRKTKWLIWSIVLGVSLVFVVMFFIIRIF